MLWNKEDYFFVTIGVSQTGCFTFELGCDKEYTLGAFHWGWITFKLGFSRKNRDFSISSTKIWPDIKMMLCEGSRDMDL